MHSNCLDVFTSLAAGLIIRNSKNAINLKILCFVAPYQAIFHYPLCELLLAAVVAYACRKREIQIFEKKLFLQA